MMRASAVKIPRSIYHAPAGPDHRGKQSGISDWARRAARADPHGLGARYQFGGEIRVEPASPGEPVATVRGAARIGLAADADRDDPRTPDEKSPNSQRILQLVTSDKGERAASSDTA
jgi:hypothetical protein